jgi:pimeloyl-ACP methyl ester carboxylesterase
MRGADTGRRVVSAIAETALGPIEYSAIGGGPPVLMLHGSPGGADRGLALAGVLALRGCRVISPSRPGYLGTSLAVGRTPEEQADACAALLDALGIGRAAVLSNSGGGIVALQFALRHPERVARLVLLQSVTARMEIAADDLLHAALLLPRATSIAPSVVAQAWRQGEPSLITQSLALAWSTLPVSARRAGMLNDATQIAGLPYYPLRTIRVPTLLVHGDADRNVPYAQSAAAAAAIPGARLLRIANGDHSSILFERRTAAAVRDFLWRG